MKVLHILIDGHKLADQLIEAQREHARVEIHDLTTRPVDYPDLLKAIFEADSVHVYGRNPETRS